MRTVACLGALALILGLPHLGHAQTMTNLEAERAARWPGSIPYDFEPYTQRYSYGTFGMFYLNGNPRALHYLDYLDKADRAYKFGYKMPADPYFYRPFDQAEVIVVPATPVPGAEQPGEPQAWTAPTPQPVRGFGILRRR